jgi:Rhs element Vgr protein
MAVSPVDISDATLRITIKVNGSAISDAYPILSVQIQHELNKISYAIITLIDGKIEASDFPISDSEDMIPGNDIEITAGYGDSAEDPIFTGIIVKQSLQINNDNGFNLVVTCKHKAVKTTLNRIEAEFAGKTDSAIMQAIMGTYGLSATIDSTTPVQEGMSQRLATDWDFILTRANFYGYVVALDGTGGDITIGKPATSGSAVLSIVAGESIISFNAEINAERQLPGITVNAWDLSNLSLKASTAAEPTINSQGNITPETLGAKLGQATLNLTSCTALSADELKVWADGSLLNMRLAAIKGDVSFRGSALARTNTIVELGGVGERFNGSAYVSAVNHTITIGTWETRIRFGLDDKPLHERIPYSYPSASGFLPAVQGLQIGVVKQLASDPESLFRILVTIPSSATDQTGFWARVASYYATNGSGSVFMPEVGDEVIIGYMENDPRYPVVLGSLYSTTKANPYPAADENNYIKAITTKGKLNVTFNDDKKDIIIQTPGGNKITISDDQKSISIEDQNSNSVKMTSSGIAINSGKDITLTATGNITLDATGKVSVSAKQDVAVAGLNISNTAQMGFTAKGNATAELSASGQTTVKGAIVMIN